LAFDPFLVREKIGILHSRQKGTQPLGVALLHHYHH